MSEVYRREDRNPNVEMAQVAVVQPKCNYHWLAIAVLVLLILYNMYNFVYTILKPLCLNECTNTKIIR